MPERECQFEVLLSRVSHDTVWYEQFAEHLRNEGDLPYIVRELNEAVAA